MKIDKIEAAVVLGIIIVISVLVISVGVFIYAGIGPALIVFGSVCAIIAAFLLAASGSI